MLQAIFARILQSADKFCRIFPCKMSEFSMFYKKKLAVCMDAFCMFYLHVQLGRRNVFTRFYNHNSHLK